MRARRLVNFWVGVGLAHPPLGAPGSLGVGLADWACVVGSSAGRAVEGVWSGRIFRRAAVVRRMPPYTNTPRKRAATMVRPIGRPSLRRSAPSSTPATIPVMRHARLEGRGRARPICGVAQVLPSTGSLVGASAFASSDADGSSFSTESVWSISSIWSLRALNHYRKAARRRDERRSTNQVTIISAHTVTTIP
jgi:hypothetical protein